MLLAHLLATKETVTGREVTRARLSEITLRRLFGRQRFTSEFLLDVQEWLVRAGWVLFAAGTTYAVVNVKVIEAWGQISSRRIADDLEKVGNGAFDYGSLEYLLLRPKSLRENEG